MTMDMVQMLSMKSALRTILSGIGCSGFWV